MAETATLGVFAGMLVVGTAMGIPLAAILAVGLVLFLAYGMYRGIRLPELLHAGASSMRSVASMLGLFVVAGALAAAWRASGTIAAIVSWSSSLIQPSAAVLAAFLLCCLMSLLMGTAFGTAATMGVICMAVSHAMGANELATGGAVLAGCYFGDRCSPLSGSAVLVSKLTGTSLYDNVRRMLRTGLVPFLVACVAYLAMGTQATGGASAAGVAATLAEKFSLSWPVIVPAVLVVALSLAHVNVLVAMAASLGAACAVCVGMQGVSPAELPQLLVFGYHATDSTVAPLIDGGGVISMASVTLVVGISSTYAGIFKKTGLLDGAVGLVTGFSRKSTPFIGVLATSVVSCMVACNQTLAIMLTDQLCHRTEGTGSALALDLENSVVIVSPLVPWSISNVAVLSSVGAPALSIVTATFCYLLPLWTLVISIWQHRRPEFPDSRPAQLLGLTPADDVRRMRAAA